MRSRIVIAAVAAIVVAGVAASARADVPAPTVTGPITGPGAIFVQTTGFDLSEVDYVAEEFFLAGTARAFTNVGPLAADGRWTVVPGATAPYKTRIVVYRPRERTRFNGTVVVEWLNVSGGVDAGPDWTHAHTELIRDGFAWVGVSAQFVGVEGGPALVGVVSLPLKTVNPARYGTLHHPGDSFSYDMFSQAAEAVRDPAGAGVLGGFPVDRLLATGDSQSAFRLVTYIDAIQPLARLFDGFLVHSRGAIGAALSETPESAIPVPGTAPIRADLDVPVLTLETETDLTFLGYASARQADTPRFRLWEVAGTSHADAYSLVAGPSDLGTSPAIVALVITAAPIPGFVDCASPINSGPHHFVMNAAFAALDRWARGGRPPRAAPRLRLAGTSPAIVRDANGNAEGGVRTPQVDVPIAAFTGEQGGSIICRLLGTTSPFALPKLHALYPTHHAFLSAFDRATRHAVRRRFVLEPDAELMRAWARTSSIGD
jgi:hypothetical protein